PPRLPQTPPNLSAAGALRSSQPDELIDAYRSRGGFEAVVTRAGRVYLSGPQVTLQAVPDGVRALGGRGDLGYQRGAVERALRGPGPPRREWHARLLLLLRGRPLARAGAAAEHPARRCRHPRPPRRGRGDPAGAGNAPPGRPGERRGALARGRPARDAVAGRGAGRVRRVGAGVQRNGRGARSQ